MKIKRVLDSVNSRSLLYLLKGLYHRKGPGRKPYNPMSMLKAQLLKHLLRIPSDRRLALRLKHDSRAARACGFRRQTPSHGLFTRFRHRLGEAPYMQIFNDLLWRLLESGVVKGEVVAVDSTHVKARAQRWRRKVKASRVQIQQLRAEIDELNKRRLDALGGSFSDWIMFGKLVEDVEMKTRQLREHEKIVNNVGPKGPDKSYMVALRARRGDSHHPHR